MQPGLARRSRAGTDRASTPCRGRRQRRRHGRLPGAGRRGRTGQRGFWRAWRARRWLGASRSPRCWTIPMRPLPLVRRRPAQCVLQLPGPARRQRAGRAHRHCLRSRRRRGDTDQLPRPAGALPTGQRHEGLRHPARRPGGDLPAHVGRGHRRHAGLQPDRRDPLGGLRRLLGQVAERTHRRHRRSPADHRGRAGARRQDAAAQAHRRRSAGHGRLRRRAPRVRVPPHRRQDRLGRGARRLAARSRRRPARTLRARLRTRSIRCSCSTPPAPPASPRACSTPRPAICCGPRRPCAGPST